MADANWMAVLPEKLDKTYKLAQTLLVPAAKRAAGPVLVNFKAGGDNRPGPDKGAAFEQQFSDLLLAAFAAILERPKPADKKKKSAKEEREERISKLSLLSKEELEAQLAVEKQGRQLYEVNQFALSCFSMRLEKIISRPFLLADNPLHPKQLATMFNRCAEGASDNANSRSAAVASWNKACEKFYPEVLAELNNALIRQRVLPDLDEEAVNNRYKHGREAEKQKAEAMRKELISQVTGKPAEGADAAKPEEMVEGLAQLVKNASLQNPEMQKHIVSTKTGPAIATTDVIDALRDVKQPEVRINPETGYREADMQQTLASLLKASTNLSSFALNDQTQGSIALLSMMFEKFKAEETIAQPIKPLLDDLQLPILKKALKDENFFADAENSAQQLVNEIAKAGTHWTPKANAAKDNFYKKIVSIVEDVKERHEENEEVFEENLQTLAEFVEKEEQRAAVLEERILEAEQAAARAEAARARVKLAIAVRTSRKAIPPLTRQFINQQWEPVLFFHYNKDEQGESEELQKALADLELLIEAGIGSPVNLKDLFTSMNKQMTELGQEKADREHTLKALLDELKTQRINAERRRLEEERMRAEGKAPPAAAEVIEPEPEEEETPDVVVDQYTAQVASLRPNSWYHYKPEDSGEIQKIKLAAIIKHNGSYVFVSREGMKVLTGNQHDIAGLLRSGKLLMVEDGILFDRALESVIGTLRSAS